MVKLNNPCLFGGAGAPYSEAGVDRCIFQISLVASIGTIGSVGRIERSVSASIERQWGV